MMKPTKTLTFFKQVAKNGIMPPKTLRYEETAGRVYWTVEFDSQKRRFYVRAEGPHASVTDWPEGNTLDILEESINGTIKILGI